MYKNNYILTYLCGYEQHVFDRFIGSLFDTDFKDKLVIFSKEESTNKIEIWRGKYPENIIHVVCEPEYHPVTYRYKAYLDFLLKLNENTTGLIFLTDSKDVLFQKDIFSFDFDLVKNYNTDPIKDLYFFEEDGFISECRVNAGWLKQLFHELGYNKDEINNELKRFFYKKIVYAGNTLGSYKGLLTYLHILNNNINNIDSAKKQDVYGPDQALHNVIRHTSILDNFIIENNLSPISIQNLDNNDGLVNNLGWGIARGTSFLSEDGYIQNKYGETSFCFHLYDRIPGLSDKLMKFPQWSKYNLN